MSEQWRVETIDSPFSSKIDIVDACSEEEAIQKVIEQTVKKRKAIRLADYQQMEKDKKAKQKWLWEDVDKWAYSNDECLFRRVNKDGEVKVFRYFDPDIYEWTIVSVQFSDNGDEMTISSEEHQETWCRVETSLENILILFSCEDEGDDELNYSNVSAFLDFAQEFFGSGSRDPRFKKMAKKAFAECLKSL